MEWNHNTISHSHYITTLSQLCICRCIWSRFRLDNHCFCISRFSGGHTTFFAKKTIFEIFGCKGWFGWLWPVNKLHHKHSTASASYMYSICHIDNMIPLQVDLLFHVPWSEDLYIWQCSVASDMYMYTALYLAAPGAARSVARDVRCHRFIIHYYTV